MWRINSSARYIHQLQGAAQIPPKAKTHGNCNTCYCWTRFFLPGIEPTKRQTDTPTSKRTATLQVLLLIAVFYIQAAQSALHEICKASWTGCFDVEKRYDQISSALPKGTPPP